MTAEIRYDLDLPGRIRFGRGSAAAALPEISSGASRILLVASRSAPFAAEAARALSAEGMSVEVVHGSGEPDIATVEAMVARARDIAPDKVLSIGGGSVIDLGKAIAALAPQPSATLTYLEVVGDGAALETAPLPFVAMPTTAGTGAEATKNAVIGLPEHGRKVSLRDARMVPDLAVVDPALTDGCPAGITLASGLDAIVQVIEPYLSSKANTFTDAICRDAIPRGLDALPRLMAEESEAARDAMAHVSLSGGIALANSGLGAVHGFAGVIGGRTGMAHGAICGRLLVPVLALTEEIARRDGHPVLERVTEIRRMIAAAMGTSEAGALDALAAWADAHGLPHLPASESGNHAAWVRDAQGSSSMKGHPFPLTEYALAQVLSAASA